MKQSVKKLLTMILTLSMVMMMAVPAFADEDTTALGGNEVSGSASQDVTASYTAESLTSSGDVYYVTISWEAIEEDIPLSYTGKQATYTWSGTALKYTEDAGATKAAWSGAAGYKVTVSNRSNVEVYAKTSATNTYNLALVVPNDETQKAGSAAVTGESNTAISVSNVDTEGTAQTVDFTYTYSANDTTSHPDGKENGTVTVGTISLTISKTEPTSASATSGGN